MILDVQAWTDAPAPVDWANTWEDGHYVVLVGLHEKNIYLMDPSTGAAYAYVPLREFEDRWHDYLILPDGSRKEYIHMGIYIKGATPLPSPPDIMYMA